MSWEERREPEGQQGCEAGWPGQTCAGWGHGTALPGGDPGTRRGGRERGRRELLIVVSLCFPGGGKRECDTGVTGSVLALFVSVALKATA